jgi:hypothetical protein
MAATKYLLLYYSLKMPLLGDFLNYGTNTMINNGTPSPHGNLVFKISQ